MIRCRAVSSGSYKRRTEQGKPDDPGAPEPNWLDGAGSSGIGMNDPGSTRDEKDQRVWIIRPKVRRSDTHQRDFERKRLDRRDERFWIKVYEHVRPLTQNDQPHSTIHNHDQMRQGVIQRSQHR